MTSTFRVTVAMALAAMAAACGGQGEEPGAETRRVQDERAGTQQITVTGCLDAASGTSEYVLRHVRVAPPAEQPSDAQTAQGSVITEGSWVKLRVDDADRELRDHVGQMVTIVGHVTDTGRDTIGTSGVPRGPDEPGPRKDASRAATGEHYSDKVAKEAGPIGQQSLTNSTAPEIAVQRVTATGQACPSGPR